MDYIIDLKGVVMEDFCNYRESSMFLITPWCDFKCCHEAGLPIDVCQNAALRAQDYKTYSVAEIFDAYMQNGITQAVVIGGMEPFLAFDQLEQLIRHFRANGCNDTIVIYTGYTEEELADEIDYLSQWPNIIVKFGRFVPNQTPHFDPVLGVDLISDNQYAKVISKEVL